MSENTLQAFIDEHAITAKIEEVRSHSPQLYYPQSNRCWRATLRMGGKQQTFYVYAGLGWSSYSLEQVLWYLKDTNDGNYDTWQDWDKDNGGYYSQILSEEGVRLYWEEQDGNYRKLVKFFGYALFDELESIA